jgi:hypothetical protein
MGPRRELFTNRLRTGTTFTLHWVFVSHPVREGRG